MPGSEAGTRTEEEVRAAGPSRRSTRLAGTAFVVPSVAWVLSLGVSYALEDYSCSAAGSAGADAPRQGVFLLLMGLNVVLLLVCVGAGVIGVRAARQHRDRGPAAPVRFLGWTGAVMGLYFGLSIVLIGLAPLFLEVCS
jgi:hypothetical protein